MEGFSSAQGSQGTVSSRSGRRRRQARVLRPTPDHPEMVAVSGREVQQQQSSRCPLYKEWQVVYQCVHSFFWTQIWIQIYLL